LQALPGAFEHRRIGLWCISDEEVQIERAICAIPDLAHLTPDRLKVLPCTAQ
jgi:hypothetical protein